MSSSTLAEDDEAETVRILDHRGDLWLVVGSDFVTSDGETCSPCTFQVCPRALARCSPVFAAMLFGPFAESKPAEAEGRKWQVKLPDDDPIAAYHLLQIIHGNFGALKNKHAANSHDAMAPRITFLHGLLFLADKYDCLPSLRPWPFSWARYCQRITRYYLDDLCARGAPEHLAMLVWICYYLGDETAFGLVFRYLVEVFDFGDNDQDNFPYDLLPGKMRVTIFAKRAELKAMSVKTVQSALERLSKGTPELFLGYATKHFCNNDAEKATCAAALHATLIRRLEEKCIWPLDESMTGWMSPHELKQRLGAIWRGMQDQPKSVQCYHKSRTLNPAPTYEWTYTVYPSGEKALAYASSTDYPLCEAETRFLQAQRERFGIQNEDDWTEGAFPV
ncbi:BTB/POZ domain-containing protein 3/6 [Microdochium nivale]|nr:BTB/POZ domain-containing protein 3/6 [Microdochium nivale]